MGYMIILDFQKGEVLIDFYVQDTENDAEEDAQFRVGGHTDFQYMCVDELKLKINENVH